MNASRLAVSTPLTALAFAVLGGVMLTGHQPAPVAVPHVDAGAGKPANVPTWTAQTAAAFPGCSARKVLGDVVFVGQDGKARRVSFSAAWKRTHDASKGDDGWAIGWCK